MPPTKRTFNKFARCFSLEARKSRMKLLAGLRSMSGMELEWIRNVIRQCEAAGVAFFVTQDSAFQSEQRGRLADDILGGQRVSEE